VFRRFIGVFARPEHPLALFLDDLQWLDGATLDLLEDLLTRSDLQRLMLIGAYRDNEVDAPHPLTRKLDAIRQIGARVQEIRLAPLARDDLGQLIADALRCDPPHVAPLAQLVHEKTAGNPFFVIQFLCTLAEEGLLRFDHDAACWSWNLDRIHDKGYTDNVVDLMVGKLSRLPAETQQALQQFACLGNIAAIATLSIVLQMSQERVHAALWPAVHQELVERRDGHYRFIHDRVQEAAYSLIPEALRAEVHLRIGRQLAAQTPPEKQEEAIFEIVGQLNRGAGLITQQEERDQLAALNLLAGKRAKRATGYASALSYLNAGAIVLAENSWERRRELIFALELNRAETEFLTGALAAADERLSKLATRAANTVERATVACLRVDLYTNLGQSSRAITIGLEYLQGLGLEWSPHPTNEDVRREYERIWTQLGNRAIEDLIKLPLMTCPASLSTMDVLTKLGAPAAFTDANLFALVTCRAVNLSLEHGNCDGSCFAYVWLGLDIGARFSDYDITHRFGQLGYDLVEGRGLKRFLARTYMEFGNVVLPWTTHVRAGRDLVRRAFEAANEIGDIAYAALSCTHMNTNLLAAGDPLAEAQREAEHGLAFAQGAGFGLVVDLIVPPLALIRTLRGLTPTFGSFDDEQFEELQIERHFAGNSNLMFAESWYAIRKLQARFFAGDYASALAASSQARHRLWGTPQLSQFENAEYHFYSALSHTASWDSALDERQQHVDAVAAHHRQLQVWAKHCPENFENRAALVGAEIARLEGRDVDAMHLYEQAVRLARDNGFIQNEAIAYEVAARFYAARGFEEFARVYLRNARYCYLRWGADGKVRQLEEMYPQLREEMRAPDPAGTIATPVEHLDLATVIKVSQAVSGEMVLAKVIDTLMRTAIAQAGAERGLLILSRGAEPRIEAEATTSGDAVRVEMRDLPVTAAVLPETDLHYVLRTRESVILDDAAAQPSFAADTYIRQCQARSILCLPLINRAKLIGVLYLENNLAPRVFAPAAIAVLKLLASQAAISLENTRLYRDLAEREAKIRRLVDANIVAIFSWDLEGLIIEANDEFLRIAGYEREDLVAGRMRWTDLTPPEWREIDEQHLIPEMRMTGCLQPFEKEFLRKDGSRVPVLIGIATFEQNQNQGVAFVLDLTERKRAEQALREREAKIRGLFEANIIATFIGDIEGQVIEANNAFFNMLGYNREDVASGRVHRTKMTPPEWRERDARTRVELETTGTVQPFEKEYWRKDGSRVPVLVGAAVFQPDRVVAFVLDISERKRAEYELQASEELKRKIIESSKDCIKVMDLDGNLLFMSSGGQQLLEIDDIQHYLNSCWIDFWQLEDRPTIREAVAAARVGEIGKFQAFCPSAKGAPRWWDVIITPICDADGQPEQLLAVSRDITQHKQAERALRDSEEQWKAVFENNPTMYFMVDMSSVIVSVNPLGAEQLGYTVDELIGRPVQDLFHAEDREAVERNAVVCFQRPGQTVNWEARKVRKNGDVLWVREMARVMLIRDRPVALIVCEDITERKRVSEALGAVRMELAHANRVATIGQLTASIAHEVNQPIAAARNNAAAALRFLSGSSPDLGEAREALDWVMNEADRAGDIIGRIRAHVKKEPPLNARFDINDAINELVALTRSEVGEKGVAVRIRLAEGLPAVQGDRVQLQQVVLNLILNAVEAMSSVDDAPRELSISTEGRGVHEVLVAVSDSGPGINPENLERVFDSFYTTKRSGMGLGLSICRFIVDAHGGRLWAETNEPRGAVFRFTVPAETKDS
jgi:PAS domain S-box-containing protein